MNSDAIIVRAILGDRWSGSVVADIISECK